MTTWTRILLGPCRYGISPIFRLDYTSMISLIYSIDINVGEVGPEGDAYNLQRIRSSTLGQSAPSLTANSVVSFLR